MSAAPGHAWLPLPPHATAAAIPLFCFPHSGARWTVFRDWDDELPAPLAVAAVDYPRDPKTGASPFGSLEELARAALEGLRTQLRGPALFFGHSLGALVAYEVVRALTDEGAAPIGLLLSGRRAPHLPAATERSYELPRPAFRELIVSWGGVISAIADDEESFAHFEPALRADIKLAETHETPGEATLGCPVAALAGLNDPVAHPDTMAPWAELTTGSFDIDVLPGNHFFLFQSRHLALSILARRAQEMIG